MAAGVGAAEDGATEVGGLADDPTSAGAEPISSS
jgi:hypothetical protein